MAKVKEITKKKSVGRIIMVILIVILCLVLAMTAAMAVAAKVLTKPSKDTEQHHPIGGMVVSDTVDYQAESGKAIQNHPVVKMMQLFWLWCEKSDNETHAKQTPPENIVKDTDIPYLDDGNIYHQLDVYYPEGTKAGDRLPVIIDIHGGGWIYGDKNLNEYYCLELARKGYTVFSISYRLVPDVTVNEQLQDCAAALQWIHENRKNYPCDEHILLTGDSAGGQLAAYSAALAQSEELRKAFDVTDCGLDFTALLLTSPAPFMNRGDAFSVYTKLMWGKDERSKAMEGYMNLSDIVDKASLPPTYLITSDGDMLAHDQTIQAYELLKSKGVDCEMVNFGNDENGKALPHVFSVLDPFCKSGQDAIDGALAFYREAMK